MRRARYLSIPLAIGLLVLVGVVVSEAQRTPEWQVALRQAINPADSAILQVIHARAPENFAPALVARVVDYGKFQGLALPRSPREVYCIVLREDANRSLVFVSHYSDNLWRDDWIVQLGPVFPLENDTRQTLAALGCDFENVGP
jgi:hypothetical protein